MSEWQRSRGNDPIPASVAFRSLLSDAQVQQLAERQNVRISALKMHLSGFAGSHRSRNPMSPDVAVGRARQQAIAFAERANRNKRQTIQRFLNDTTRTALKGEARVTAARSLLGFSERVAAAAGEPARTGAPVIYGIEVVGPAESISALRADPLVAAVEPAFEINGKVVVPPPARPSDVRIPRPSEGQEGRSPTEVFEQLQAIARGAGR